MGSGVATSLEPPKQCSLFYFYIALITGAKNKNEKIVTAMTEKIIKMNLKLSLYLLIHVFILLIVNIL